MIFKIHFTIDGQEDHFFIEGETMEVVTQLVDHELKKRSLHPETNNVWSRKIPDK